MSRHWTYAVLAGAALVLPADSHRAAAQSPKLSPGELAGWIDGRIEAHWREQELEPAPLVDDATFLRRVYLDLVGTIPSVSQTRDFLDEPGTYKRQDVVGTLVRDDRSAEHLARVWRRTMVPAGTPGAATAARVEPWLTQQFAANIPYDEFARSLLTATGDTAGAQTSADQPVVFYFVIGNSPDNLADAFSRVFLGVRIGCAKCHDHPFSEWKQEDFWGMAAFFAGSGAAGQFSQAVADRRTAVITPEDSRTEYTARFLGGNEAVIPQDKFPRQVLADWMVSPENSNFTATAVNRVWQHLFGRGLVDSVNDLDQASPEERAVLLDDLAAKFAESGFDLRWLIQAICSSRTYQRASRPGAGGETLLSAHRPLKVLAPEQVFDALEQALMLPVSNSDYSPRYNGLRLQLVSRLDEAFTDSPEQFRAGIPQALMMMNGKLTADATDLDESRTLRAVVDAPFLEPAEKLDTLYLAALTRKPRPQERETFLKHIQNRPTEAERRQAYAEIFWALLNSPEFVLCR